MSERPSFFISDRSNSEREYGRFYYASEIPESPPEHPWCPYGYSEARIVSAQASVSVSCDNVIQLKVVGSDCI